MLDNRPPFIIQQDTTVQYSWVDKPVLPSVSRSVSCRHKVHTHTKAPYSGTPVIVEQSNFGGLNR